MDERTKAAFEGARDTAKQLTALATGVLALTVTFSKDFSRPNAEGRELVHAAWYLLLVSAAAGIWVLMSVTGSLAKETSLTHASVYKPNIVAPAAIQVLTFAAGLLLAVLFGVKN